MRLDGTNVVFMTHTPSQDELETCTHLHLTSQREWDPMKFTTPSIELSQVTDLRNCTYFAAFYPLDSKSKAGDSLRAFCNEYGILEIL
jgi:hypothetical protein